MGQTDQKHQSGDQSVHLAVNHFPWSPLVTPLSLVSYSPITDTHFISRETGGDIEWPEVAPRSDLRTEGFQLTAGFSLQAPPGFGLVKSPSKEQWSGRLVYILAHTVFLFPRIHFVTFETIFQGV